MSNENESDENKRLSELLSEEQPFHENGKSDSSYNTQMIIAQNNKKTNNQFIISEDAFYNSCKELIDSNNLNRAKHANLDYRLQSNNNLNFSAINNKNELLKAGNRKENSTNTQLLIFEELISMATSKEEFNTALKVILEHLFDKDGHLKSYHSDNQHRNQLIDFMFRHKDSVFKDDKVLQKKVAIAYFLENYSPGFTSNKNRKGQVKLLKEALKSGNERKLDNAISNIKRQMFDDNGHSSGH